uniref:Clathrin light chain n=1 Tax=Chara australis TaxID=31298 RepID=A0A1S5WIV1_9VIRI|nr:clathrin light chain 1c [Chara australis]
MDDFGAEENEFIQRKAGGGGGRSSEFFPTDFGGDSSPGRAGGAAGDPYGQSEEERHLGRFRDDGDDFGGAPLDGSGVPPLNGVSGTSAPLDLPAESELLYEWRRKRAAELEVKAEQEREKKLEIIEGAASSRSTIATQREKAMEAARQNNREKESVFLSGLEASMCTNPGGNYWATVAGMIDFDSKPEEKVPAKTADKAVDKKKSAGAASVVVNKPKPGKATDLTRMRQLLLKLKHNPGGAKQTAAETKGMNGGPRHAPQPRAVTATGASSTEWGQSVFV